MELESRIYTFKEILDLAGITVDDSTDRRGIKVGGLGFDSVDETFRVPDSADELEVTVDGKQHAVFSVK